MRIAALTSFLLAGTLSLVSAAPVRDETTRRISYSDRKPAAPRPPDDQPGWIELASPTPASHGREFIVVGADAGTFTQLRLTAASGRPGIRAVRVDYQDGKRQTFEVEQVLSARRRPAYIDLRGAHELKQIIVMTDRSSVGSYILEGNTALITLVAR